MAFCLPSNASAVTVNLSNTLTSDVSLEAVIASATPLLSNFGSSVAVGGAQGTVDSAAFTGTGSLTGLYVYTYRLSVSALEISVLSIPGFALGDIQSSFYVSGALTPGGALAQFYTSNGTVKPTRSQLTTDTGVYRTDLTDPFTFNGVTAGSASTIFGFVSAFAPNPVLAIADALGGAGGGTTASPRVVVPGDPVPEPGTLLLLGSGLTGLAAWGWRRKSG
jgi:hypothetical protein